MTDGNTTFVGGAVMGAIIGGFVVAIGGILTDDGEPRARHECEAAGFVWSCHGVAGSNGKPASGETCTCLDGGAP